MTLTDVIVKNGAVAFFWWVAVVADQQRFDFCVDGDVIYIYIYTL